MAKIILTEKTDNEKNLLYVQSNVAEILKSADCKVRLLSDGVDRRLLSIEVPEQYREIIKVELADKVSETIAIKYKYDFFKSQIKINGLNENEREILFASLIAADLKEDKRYVFSKVKELNEIAIDGVYNFWLKPLKKKWAEIVSFMPPVFIGSQLKDFVSYLLENKKKRVYVDCGRVYDSNFHRLLRTDLIQAENVKVVREIILSNCGEIELSGNISKDDEYYLREYYSDKIIFSTGYFC